MHFVLAFHWFKVFNCFCNLDFLATVKPITNYKQPEEIEALKPPNSKEAYHMAEMDSWDEAKIQG